MVNKAYKCKRCQKISKGKKKKGIDSFHKKHRCPGCGSFYFFEIDIVDGLIFDFDELIFDYEGEYIPETPENYVEEEPLEDPEEANMMNEDLDADDPLRTDDAVETCGPDVEDEEPSKETVLEVEKFPEEPSSLETDTSESSFPSFPSSPSFEDNDTSKQSSSFDSGGSSWGSSDSGSSSFDSGSSYDSGSSSFDSGSSDW